MTFVLEQQVTTGLGGLHWVRVAGPFASKREAEVMMSRRLVRIDAPMRVICVEATEGGPDGQ